MWVRVSVGVKDRVRLTVEFFFSLFDKTKNKVRVSISGKGSACV